MRRPLVIDANALVVYIVGAAGREHVISHKRTWNYGELGFRIIREAVNQHASLVVTPHSLTEASNLIGGDIQDRWVRQHRQSFTALIKHAIEVFDDARSLSLDNDWLRLGVSDTAQLFATASRNATLLTADQALHAAALRRDLKSINLLHEISRLSL
jgi:predicted nucleic acid-binding protein